MSTMSDPPIGVAQVAFGALSVGEAAYAAAARGFDHLDVHSDPGEAPLPLAIGDRMTLLPQEGCTVVPPMDCTWEKGVAWLSRVPRIRVEPGPGSLLEDAASIRRMCDEVPGLRITLDTGWAAYFDFDPLEIVDLADHIQLRQARPGVAQLHAEDATGAVDFRVFLRGAAAAGYAGRFTVEYFDLPDRGFPLADPVGWCVALRDHVRRVAAPV